MFLFCIALHRKSFTIIYLLKTKTKMDYKKIIMEVMNRNGQPFTAEDKLIDKVLTIVEFIQIIKELQELGMFAEPKKEETELQVA